MTTVARSATSEPSRAPVVANRRGSMGELVEDGTTGLLVDGLEAAGGRRRRCRCARPEDHPGGSARAFSVARMVEQYLAVYRSVLAQRP